MLCDAVTAAPSAASARRAWPGRAPEDRVWGQTRLVRRASYLLKRRARAARQRPVQAARLGAFLVVLGVCSWQPKSFGKREQRF